MNWSVSVCHVTILQSENSRGHKCSSPQRRLSRCRTTTYRKGCTILDRYGLILDDDLVFCQGRGVRQRRRCYLEGSAGGGEVGSIIHGFHGENIDRRKKRCQLRSNGGTRVSPAYPAIKSRIFGWNEVGEETVSYTWYYKSPLGKVCCRSPRLARH